MLAPRLRHRVDIEEFTTVQDSDGAVEETWVAVLSDQPAEIVPLSGREFIAAQSVQAGVTTRITLRYNAEAITEAMRIIHGSDTYNIKAVLPDSSLRRHITVMAQKGVNNG